MALTGAGGFLGSEELAIAQTNPEWCAAEHGGVVFLLFLTSVRTSWFSEVASFVDKASAAYPDARVPLLSVFRLDKRFPVDVGFDANLAELREGLRRLSPMIRASAVVLEFGGLLAFTMKSALTTMSMIARVQFPTRVHSSVISAVTWVAPHAADDRRRGVLEYVDAVDRMKTKLGCEIDASSAASRRFSWGRARSPRSR